LESVLGLGLGLGLAAACGFRVFVPLLIAGLAANSGHVTLASDLSWIGSDAAVATFFVASLFELGAYYLPWLDNLLDTIAGPLAVVAGVILTASVLLDLSPLLRWSLALIAGGGIAGSVQSTTTLLRASSTATTAGTANPAFATAELGGSVGLSLLAIVAPLVAFGLVVTALVFFSRRLRRFARRRRERGAS